MIERMDVALPSGITLSCRVAGRAGDPVLVFLHGFPEAAFVWDELLGHFATRYRCVAPNLRGFERSSAPADVAAYRIKLLVGDVASLIDSLGGRVEALIAHDWGGALAWALAASQPQRMRRLVILNSPHPATFLRDLRSSAPQQAASAYMNFLCRPDAESLLAADDFARLWPLFERMGATDAARPGGGWLTESVKERYRDVWRHGLTGGCNFYRASPLRPPTGPDSPIHAVVLADEAVTIRVPALVIWGEDDLALPATLLDGLERFVPDMHLVRVPDASHWIVHERPALIAAEIEAALGR